MENKPDKTTNKKKTKKKQRKKQTGRKQARKYITVFKAQEKLCAFFKDRWVHAPTRLEELVELASHVKTKQSPAFSFRLVESVREKHKKNQAKNTQTQRSSREKRWWQNRVKGLSVKSPHLFAFCLAERVSVEDLRLNVKAQDLLESLAQVLQLLQAREDLSRHQEYPGHEEVRDSFVFNSRAKQLLFELVEQLQQTQEEEQE